MKEKTTRLVSLLAAGKFLNSTGDWIFNVASLYLILSLTHNAWILSLYMLSKMLPALVFGAYGGVLADRLNRRHMMITIDIVRACAAILPIFAPSTTVVAVIIISTIIITSANTIFMPAEMGLITELEEANLGQANSIIASGIALAMIIGSGIGGLATGANTHLALGINSATFIVNACIVTFINWKQPARERPQQSDTSLPHLHPTQIIREMRDGLRLIRKSSILIHLFLLMIGVSLAGGGVNILLSVVADTHLKLGAIGIGLAYASLGAGSFIGSLVAPNAMNRFPHLVVLVGWTTILEGLFIGLYSLSGLPWLTLLVLVIAGFFSSINDVSIETTIMTETPKEVLGRFYGFNEIGTTTAFALSTFLTGLAILEMPLWITALIITFIWITTGILWLYIRKNDRVKASVRA